MKSVKSSADIGWVSDGEKSRVYVGHFLLHGPFTTG